MARGGVPERGGILELAALVWSNEYGPAVEADLIREGLRLRWLADGTDRLTWRDLQVHITGCAQDRHSRLYAAVNPHLVDRTTDTELLVSILHALEGANWQRSGGKGSAPKRAELPKAPRPPQAGPVSPDEIPDVDDSGSYAGEALPADEMATWLGWT